MRYSIDIQTTVWIKLCLFSFGIFSGGGRENKIPFMKKLSACKATATFFMSLSRHVAMVEHHTCFVVEKFMQDLEDSISKSIKKGEFKQEDRSLCLISY